MTDFIQGHLGEIAALFTAVCWTLNAVAFESAGKKVGSLSVSYIRLFIAVILMSITTGISRSLVFPTDANGYRWFWLSISGLVGFVLGDMFLFEAFVQIGSRISLLIMSAAPPLAALAGFFLLGEKLSPLNIGGMILTMIGISMVILSRKPATEKKKVGFNRPGKGLFFASLGALGQAFGLLLSKYGMGEYNALAATQIRLIAGAIGYTLLVTIRRRWGEIREAFQHRDAIIKIATGAVIGPFIGVTLSLIALQYTATGIVSSITTISPVLIIPFSIFVFKEKVLPKEIIGAFVSIAGVVLLFI